MTAKKLDLNDASSCTNFVKEINPRIINDKYLEKNSEFQVDLIYDDVEVISSDVLEIELKFYKCKPEQFEVINEDGCFKIKDIAKKHKPFGARMGKITILVPNGVVYNKALLENISGDLKMIGFSAKEIVAKAVHGDIKLERVEANTMNLNSVSGDIELESCNVSKLKASSVSGDIDVEDSNILENDCTSVSGEVDITANNHSN